jgi:cobalt-zinc-cadmium efflux system outer membrane protein
MLPVDGRRPSGRPTLARCLWVVGLLAPLSAGAQLTEEEAVRRVLARPEVHDLVEGEVDAASGEALRAGLWPNPVLSYAREQTKGGPAAARDDLALLTQTLDVSGKRGLRGDAAGHRVEATRARGASTRLALAAEARLRFHERLAAERRLVATAEALRRVQVLATTVGQRQAAGDASGYDRGRLERERASLAARAAVEEAGLARARARLAGLLGGLDAQALAGELLPEAAPLARDALLGQLASRPDLRALAEEAEAGALDARAGGRAWIPEPTLQGGYKRSTVQAERPSGFAVGVAIPFPLFDRGQDEALRGHGRARAARARLALETDAADAEVRGLHAQATGLLEAARRYRADALETSRRLVATAEAAYRGGALGILELVDAHRGALDAELGALELDLTARRARIELDLASGGTTR